MLRLRTLDNSFVFPVHINQFDDLAVAADVSQRRIFHVGHDTSSRNVLERAIFQVQSMDRGAIEALHVERKLRCGVGFLRQLPLNTPCVVWMYSASNSLRVELSSVVFPFYHNRATHLIETAS